MYISIQEAINLTGKSQATIYRLINKSKSKPFVKKENDTFTIDKEYLLKVYSNSYDSHSENQHEKVILTNEKMRINSEKDENHFDNPSLSIIEKKEEEKAAFNEQYYQNLVAAKEVTIQTMAEQLQSKEHQLQIKDSQLQTKDQQLNQLIERTP